MVASQVAALVIFAATIVGVLVLVLHPVHLGCPGLKCSLPVHYCVVPVLGCLCMLAAGALDGPGVAAGIVGDDKIAPYGIVILFMALAYISTSLDGTGAFAWLALHITRAARGRGRRLFVLYFLLSSLVTTFTSNDIVVMTLTPIIMHFAAATGAGPMPFLAAEFTAANIWSMAIFIGNPTNIIVASAYSLSFVGYSKWMALPTLGAGAACLAVLLAMHGRALPQALAIPQLQPAAMLADRPGAVFGAVNVLGCLAMLAAAPTLGWPLYAVTLVCAGLHMSYNFAAYAVLKRGAQQQAAPAGRALTRFGPGDGKRDGAVDEACRSSSSSSSSWPAATDGSGSGTCLQQRQQQQQQREQALARRPDQQQQQQTQQDGVQQAGQPPAVDSHSSGAGSSRAPATSTPLNLELSSPAGVGTHSVQQQQQQQPAAACAEGAARPDWCAQGRLEVKQPGFWRGVAQLPWEVVPFVLGMFVLVQGLAGTGWLDVFGAGLARCASGGVGGALFCVGGASTVLANLMNNQPMTILMTRVLTSPAFEAGVPDPRARQAAAFALVVASNVAANFTPLAALAGIMWLAILRRRGLAGFGCLGFLRLMAPVGLACTAVALLVLWVEFLVFP